VDIPIYWINLANRIDRRDFMKRQFGELGLAATRVEAVTGDEVSPADIAVYCDPRRFRRMSPAECACSLSHLKALRAFLSTSAPVALIFEDDMILSPRLPKFLAGIDPDHLAFDLLRLETSEEPIRVLNVATIAEIEIVRYLGYDPGSGGYLVSRRGAQKILASRKARERPVDQALFDSFSPLGQRLVLWATIPGLCAQTRANRVGVPELPSDITGPAATPNRPTFRNRLHQALTAVRRDTIVGARKQWFQRVEGARTVRIPFASDETEPEPLSFRRRQQATT
jgi:glycosyl transferase family 25